MMAAELSVGMDHDALLLLCGDLVTCVNKIMDPSSLQTERDQYSQVPDGTSLKPVLFS